MKNFIILFLCFIWFSCDSQKKTISNFPVKKIADKFIEAQIQSGVDTILVFAKSCSGCIFGVKKIIYVFCKHNGLTKIKKIDSYLGEEKAIKIEDITSYFFTYENEIRNQVLDDPEFILSHYYYTEIRLILKGSQFYEKVISDQYFNSLNDEKRLIIWIQKIESRIFNLESRN